LARLKQATNGQFATKLVPSLEGEQKMVKIEFILASVVSVISLTIIGASCFQPEAPEPTKFASDKERQEWILATLLPWMEQFRERYHNVPRSDGEFLRWLIVATQRKRALEIGTANGYSAIWLGLGLEATGGHLTTVEIQPNLVSEAKENLRRAGLLGRVVTVIEGDALKVVPQLEEKFDFAFVDIGPRALSFVEVALPKLAENAIIAVHRPPFEGALRDYIEAMMKRSQWLTTIVQTGAPTAIVLSVKHVKKQ